MKTGIYWQDPKYALRPGRGFIRDPSLVLDLPLYKLDGASFMSKDAYGHLAVVTGALWTPRGRSFDGLDDIINLGQPAALDITEAITVEVWGKRTASTTGTLASRYDHADNAKRAWSIRWVDNNYVYFGAGGLSAHKAFAVSDRDWHHFVGTYDRAIIKLYIDTVLGVTAEGTDALLTPAINTLIGACYNVAPTLVWPFPGLIGEIRIYRGVALNLLGVQQNYLATKWRYQ